MAKQAGAHPFTGKMGETIGYKVNGKHLCREDGALTGKQVRNNPRFGRTMEFAAMFGQASKAVVLIYRALPKEQRKHGVYGKLTGKAMSLLKDGKTVEEVKDLLIKQYVDGREPLVVVSEEAGVDNVQAVTGNRVRAGATEVVEKKAAHEPSIRQDGQHYVVAIIVRPYYCSTVSV
jgi:hypothetical protein